MLPIKNCFKQDKCLFIPFVMAGFPNLETSLEAILALVAAGADIIELGVPFSDPVADGPIIQNAAEVALQNGVTLAGCIELVKKLRELDCNIPIILFSYFNPIYSMGIKKFCELATAAGVNGVLIVDLPPEEGVQYYPIMRGAGLEIILLASPTTEVTRFNLYTDLSPSFIYYISRCGVTGVQNNLATNLQQEVASLRVYFPTIPIAVGFGISTAEQAGIVAGFADGVVVGSYLLEILGR